MSLDLDAIEARAKAATPGPWVYNSYSAVTAKGDCPALSHPLGAHHRERSDCDGLITVIAGVSPSVGDQACANHRADAEFIAAAREDIPALVDEIRKFRRYDDGIDHKQCGECCPSPEAHYFHLWQSSLDEIEELLDIVQDNIDEINRLREELDEA